jgi:beta-glucosidase
MNWRDITAAGGGAALTSSAYDSSEIGAMAASRDAIAKDNYFQQEMRQAIKYYLYQMAQSNAMNGISSTTEIVYVATWYENALKIATWALAELTALCLVLAVVKDLKSRKQ